jgi:hypothetical protein
MVKARIKGLTLHRPWGYAIAYLDKRVENRAYPCFLNRGDYIMIPIDSIENIKCNQGGATDDYAFRLQIDYSDGHKFIARDEHAAKVWEFLAP